MVPMIKAAIFETSLNCDGVAFLGPGVGGTGGIVVVSSIRWGGCNIRQRQSEIFPLCAKMTKVSSVDDKAGGSSFLKLSHGGGLLDMMIYVYADPSMGTHGMLPCASAPRHYLVLHDREHSFYRVLFSPLNSIFSIFFSSYGNLTINSKLNCCID